MADGGEKRTLRSIGFFRGCPRVPRFFEEFRVVKATPTAEAIVESSR